MTATHLQLILNDDGWIMGHGPDPLTPEIINERMVSTYEGAPVDAVSWCGSNSEVCDYETDFGERIGDGSAPLVEERDRWSRRNLDHLVEIAGGPMTEICRQFRAAGLAFLPSVRMNSHYSVPWGAARFGDFRREHADWLIGGPDEVIPAPTVELGIRRGLDYRHPAVREYMLGMLCELVERFDVDGVELDYMRHPAFFRVDEGRACAYLMTDFLRRVRARFDEVGAQKGWGFDLLVRVPPTLDDALRLGLDVCAWMRERLVDHVVAGGGFIPFETPVHEFVDAARDTGCRVYGSFEGLRPALDEEVLRGIAARCWDAGVDGLYLFNYYRTPREWKQRVLGDLMERGRLPRLRKRYELDHSDRVRGKEGHGAAFHHAHPLVSLPVILEETLAGGGAGLRIEVADDVETAAAEGQLGPCALGFGLHGLRADDVLEVAVNGVVLAEEVRRSAAGWTATVYDGADLGGMVEQCTEGEWIEFDLPAPPLRSGANEVRVRLRKGSDEVPRTETIRLVEVRLTVDYTLVP